MEPAAILQLCQTAQQAIASGDVSRAEQLVLPVLRQHPAEPNLLFLGGICSMLRGNDDSAIRHFQDVLDRAPTYVPALVNLGFLYRRQHNLVLARQLLERALLHEPDNGAAWTTLAGSYVNEGQPAVGEQVARRGLARCPHSADLQWNLALLLLEQGFWREGWQWYRHRFESTVLDLPAAYSGPGCPPRLHDPAAISAGETVLCLGEQGLGDEILFASMLHDFLDDVTGRGGRLFFKGNRRLDVPFCRSFPGLTVLPPTDQPVAADWICPIGDLGGFYRNNAADFPHHRGYLTAADDRVAAIRRELHNRFGRRFLVGLAWSGGSPRTHQRYRQIPLETWLPVLRQPCQFVSLQYRDDTADVSRLWHEHRIEVARLPHLTQADDYDETFSLVAALDLVITVPTSVLHVAGSVGTPCWVVMDHRAAWRETSLNDAIIWYPDTHLRYVRPPETIGWKTVIEQVSTELASRLTSRGH